MKKANMFMYAKNRAYAPRDSSCMYPVEYTWMRNPTPATTRIIIPERGSRRNPHGMENDPTVPFVNCSGMFEIHEATRTVCSRWSAGRPSSSKNANRARARAPAMAVQATSPDVRLLK